MAYYADINLVANDTKPEINLTLKDNNTAAAGLTLDPDDSSTWALIDISDPTIVVKFRALGTSTILDTLTCTKVGPYTNGACFMIKMGLWSLHASSPKGTARGSTAFA